MDSSWNLDHITIFEFTKMMGPEGMDILNKEFLLHGQSLGLLDISRMMSDTTAQEAMIPCPNECIDTIFIGKLLINIYQSCFKTDIALF
jgi:hypothetical protein